MQIRTERELGLLIRARRKELGLDQSTLAERVGVSRQWVVEVEGGKPRAEVALVLRTLRALDLELRATAVGEPGEGPTLPVSGVDIDAIVDRARRGGQRE